MSTSDTDIIPADAPMPVRARGGKTMKQETPVAPAEKPAGHTLHVFVGTDTPVVLTFTSKEALTKACMSLSQRVNRLPTTVTCDGKAYTFIYITHFICEE